MKRITGILMLSILLGTTLSAQNVGIGTTTPANKLSVNGKMDITDSLGIGTTSPEAKLDIRGNLKLMDGTEGAGKVLKSDSNGRAGWESLAVTDLLTTVPVFPLCTGTISTVTTAGNPISVTVSGNYAYVLTTASNTMQVFDISNPAAPTLAGSVTTGNTPNSVAVSGIYAYVTNSNNNSLQVFNISNPAAPTLSASVATGSNPRSVAVSGNYAYLINYGSGLMQAFNISNPAAPVLVGSVSTWFYPTDLAVSGNYAYIVNSGSANMQVFNISNPASLTLSGSVTTGLSPESVAVSGNYAYVVNRSNGYMHVFNISNPAAPAQVSSVYAGWLPSSVAVSGIYAYVMNQGDENMKIFNISNPAAPTITATVATGAGPLSVTMSGNYAYFVNLFSNTLQVVNNNPCSVNYNLNFNPGTGQTTLIPSQWTKSGTNLYNTNSGNIGIGTITPAQKLDVAGTTRTTNLQITSGAANGFVLRSDATGNASWVNANTIETDPKVGTLTSNKIPKWNGTTLADGLVLDNGTNIGIGTSTPATTLDVNGGIKTKYSGSSVLAVTAGVTTPYQLTIPALPSGWDYTNTVLLLSAADGAHGYMKQVKLTSLTTIDVYFDALQTGAVRFNWIIFKM